MKEEALKLADLMIDVTDCETSEFYRAGQMIRKLVEENDRIIRDLIGASLYEHDYKTLIEKLKPLSDEEIQVLINNVPDYDIGIYELFEFARAIEERHGIK